MVRRGSAVGVTLPVAGLDVRVLDRLLHQAWEAQTALEARGRGFRRG